MADKLGIYKAIIIGAGFLTGFIHLPLLWLESAHKIHVAELNETIQLAGGPALTSVVSSTAAAVPSEYILPILLLIRILGFLFLDATLTVNN